MKPLLIFIISISLIACAGNNSGKFVKDPYNKAEVSQKIYEKKSEFGEHHFYSPAIRKDYGTALAGNWLSVQLMKTEKNEYFLRIHNYYGAKSYKFIQSVTTLDKKTHKINDIERKVDDCTTTGFGLCYLQELAFWRIDEKQYLTGLADLKIRINSKENPMVTTLPKQYIQAFMEKAK